MKFHASIQTLLRLLSSLKGLDDFPWGCPSAEALGYSQRKRATTFLKLL